MKREENLFRGCTLLRLCAVAVVLFAVVTAKAGEWGLHWIGHPQADSTEQLLFVREVQMQARPLVARVSVASEGRFALFVNGYNVSTDVLEPGCGVGADTVVVVDYDVARYMKEGVNVLAVWYSPVGVCAPTSRQLSLTLSGKYASSGGFSFCSDGSWLCRTAGCRTLPDGGEVVDGTLYDPMWAVQPSPTPAWMPVVETVACGFKPVVSHSVCRTAMRIGRVEQCGAMVQDGRHCASLMPVASEGWVRLTLRGMQSGDTVAVNGLSYICSGDIDEQACRRFTSSLSRQVDVVLPQDRQLSCITNVELIGLEHYVRRGLWSWY